MRYTDSKYIDHFLPIISMIARTHNLLTSMIEKVLENSGALQISDGSIREIASATIESTPVLEIFSELENDSWCRTGERDQLMHQIELLGIVTAMIDRCRAVQP